MKEYHLLILEKGNCAFCGKKISNPICEKCLLAGLIILKNESRFSRNNRIIQSALKDIDALEEKPLCIVCRRREVSICPICFYEEFGDILFPRELKESQELLTFS